MLYSVRQQAQNLIYILAQLHVGQRYQFREGIEFRTGRHRTNLILMTCQLRVTGTVCQRESNSDDFVDRLPRSEAPRLRLSSINEGSLAQRRKGRHAIESSNSSTLRCEMLECRRSFIAVNSTDEYQMHISSISVPTQANVVGKSQWAA